MNYLAENFTEFSKIIVNLICVMYCIVVGLVFTAKIKLDVCVIPYFTYNVCNKNCVQNEVNLFFCIH